MPGISVNQQLHSTLPNFALSFGCKVKGFRVQTQRVSPLNSQPLFSIDLHGWELRYHYAISIHNAEYVTHN